MINWGNFSGFFTTGIPSVVLYPSFIVTIVLIVAGTLCGKVQNKVRYALYVLLVEYLFVVVCSTVIFREYYSMARWELMPFWTYKAVIDHTPGVMVWDIILNVVMFVPLGFFVKLLYPEMSIVKLLVMAISFSLCIEVLQSLLSKGISQFDDLMHNTIGALIGWLIAKGVLALSSKKTT